MQKHAQRHQNPKKIPHRTERGLERAQAGGGFQISPDGGRKMKSYCSGLPSASILRTSPRFSSRTPASTLPMSPTTTHTSLPGTMDLAASALACSGVIANTVSVKVL